jgi:hypothetical protein
MINRNIQSFQIGVLLFEGGQKWQVADTNLIVD